MSGAAVLSRPAVGPLVAAQLCTAVGDNALLIVALALLARRGAAGWMSPALRVSCYLGYLALAPWAGALADRCAKGRVLVFVNLAKLAGCGLLAAAVHPLLAFGAIGLAGVFHGPAKYGILAELVPRPQLVAANAWIEAVTVGAIVGGTVLGALVLRSPLWLGRLDTARQASLLLGASFALAAGAAVAIPATGRARGRAPAPPRRFGRQLALLWGDRDGRLALGVSALFWAVAAVLQFLVIAWAQANLHVTLAAAALLQSYLAAGVILGALGAGRWMPVPSRPGVLAPGVGLGLSIILLSQVSSVGVARLVLIVVGLLAGIVMVPMNALLQQRGDCLMAPGAAVAVQSFGENLAALVFLAVYGLLLALALPLHALMIGLGGLVLALLMLLGCGQPRAAMGAR